MLTTILIGIAGQCVNIGLVNAAAEAQQAVDHGEIEAALRNIRENFKNEEIETVRGYANKLDQNDLGRALRQLPEYTHQTMPAEDIGKVLWILGENNIGSGFNNEVALAVEFVREDMTQDDIQWIFSQFMEVQDLNGAIEIARPCIRPNMSGQSIGTIVRALGQLIQEIGEENANDVLRNGNLEGQITRDMNEDQVVNTIRDFVRTVSDEFRNRPEQESG